jgi:hypothetical protein
MTSSAAPVSHVVYACHLNQCSGRGIGAPSSSVFST